MSNKRRFRKEVDEEDTADVDMDDMSNSEDEYTEIEKRLLEKARKKKAPENFDSDDEVYGLQGDDDGDDDEEEDVGEEDERDSMESDIEGQGDEDLPDERAWGQKKKAYYSTDYVDQDYASMNQNDLVVAEMEEQEARNIQKRLADQLDDADFGLDLVQTRDDEAEEAEESEQLIKTDLSKLGKRQKQALMQKESPEFSGLVNDFNERLTEARDILEPFLELVKEGKCPNGLAVTFIETKYQLILNYCVNISFYLVLKAKRLPVNSHPVIKRLAQYRQLLSQMESKQGTLLDQAVEILRAVKDGKPLYNAADNMEIVTEKKRRGTLLLGEKIKRAKKDRETVIRKETIEESKDESEVEKEESVDREVEMKDSDNEEDNEETEHQVVQNMDTEEGRRAITYQIAKNRGLTPYRKKELRNPRVKHRNKFRKAKIRRKGAVREVRKETSRYGGEMSGIKASVKKSIKLK